MKLRIQSNTGPLQGRIQRTVERFQAELVARLRAELPWRSTAEAALRGLAQPSDLLLVEIILAGLRVEPTPQNGVTAVLPTPAAGFNVDAAGGTDPGGRPRGGEDAEDRRRRIQGQELLTALALVDLEGAVRQWVNTPYTSREDPASGKDLTAADLARGPEPTEATVEALMRILGAVPLSPAEEQSPARIEAAGRLLARIEAFVEAKVGGDRGTKARARLLVDAVIAAWDLMVRREIPRIARDLMRSMLSSGVMSLSSAGRPVQP